MAEWTAIRDAEWLSGETGLLCDVIVVLADGDGFLAARALSEFPGILAIFRQVLRVGGNLNDLRAMRAHEQHGTLSPQMDIHAIIIAKLRIVYAAEFAHFTRILFHVRAVVLHSAALLALRRGRATFLSLASIVRRISATTSGTLMLNVGRNNRFLRLHRRRPSLLRLRTSRRRSFTRSIFFF